MRILFRKHAVVLLMISSISALQINSCFAAMVTLGGGADSDFYVSYDPNENEYIKNVDVRQNRLSFKSNFTSGEFDEQTDFAYNQQDLTFTLTPKDATARFNTILMARYGYFSPNGRGGEAGVGAGGTVTVRNVNDPLPDSSHYRQTSVIRSHAWGAQAFVENNADIWESEPGTAIVLSISNWLLGVKERATGMPITVFDGRSIIDVALVSTPLPAALPLFMSALLVLALIKRRQRKHI